MGAIIAGPRAGRFQNPDEFGLPATLCEGFWHGLLQNNPFVFECKRIHRRCWANNCNELTVFLSVVSRCLAKRSFEALRFVWGDSVAAEPNVLLIECAAAKSQVPTVCR